MRERILARIHRALEHRSKTALPFPLSPPPLSPQAALDLFQDRLQGNGGEVVHLSDLAAARAWLEGFAHGFGGAAVGPKVPQALHPNLPAQPPENAALGVSWALGAVAETGSLLLDSRDGRRTQLLPPTHLVFVSQECLYSSLAEALEALKGDLPAAIGLHSGPSKSADIGQIMVKGVHGPGRLVAAVIAQPKD